MDAREKQISELFSQLAEGPQDALLSYANYLVAEHGIKPPVELTEPLDLPRPEKESVIAAIRRLSATYPMIEKRSMFDVTSGLMMKHTLNGMPANEVIDDLEAAFRSHYEQLSEADSGAES